MNKMKRLTGRKILLVAVAFCAFGFAKAQDTQTEKNTLTLTLDKALEIALDNESGSGRNRLKESCQQGSLAKSVAGGQHCRFLRPYN